MAEILVRQKDLSDGLLLTYKISLDFLLRIYGDSGILASSHYACLGLLFLVAMWSIWKPHSLDFPDLIVPLFSHVHREFEKLFVWTGTHKPHFSLLLLGCHCPYKVRGSREADLLTLIVFPYIIKHR